MAYSAATYKGDGSQSTFIIPFDYLQKDFVKVTINEVDKVYAQDYNVDGRELRFPTAPPTGSIIKVYRETPTDRMVKWNEGSVLTSSNMTTQQIQELHLIEETTYNLEDSAMVKTEDGHKWEGKYLPIIHVGDPTDDSDAVNLGTIKKEETGFLASVRSQLDTWLAELGTTYNNYSKSLKDTFDSYTNTLKNQFDTHTASLLKDFNDYKTILKTNFDSYTSNLKTTFNDCKDTLLSKYNEYLASLTATKDAVKDSEANASKYKDEAKSASDSAKESANQCSTSVTTCTTRVNEANQAKETAGTYANTATTKATESGNSAALAKKWAVSAESPDGAVGSKSSKTWAEEAKASEQKATTSANNAKASENNAKTSEENAKASETASANSANASAKSATAAKASENNAKTSEENAKASEVAAAESANQAAAGQVNADWNVTDSTSKAFVKNKPINLVNIGNNQKFDLVVLNKNENNGYPVYFLMHELVQYNPNKATWPIYTVYGFNGMVFSYPRNGNGQSQFMAIVKVGLGFEYNDLYSSSSNYSPVVIKDETNNKYYWAMEISGSYQTVYMLGAFTANPLNTVISAVNKEGTLPERWSLVYTARPYPFDNTHVASADKDGQGNTIDATYLKKSNVATALTTKTLTATDATFTGQTSVPTANAGNSSKAIASTEFVAKSIASLVGSAPETLNTLNEIATALGNDPNFSTTILNELSKKMNSAEAESTFAKKEDAGVLSGTVMAFSGTFENGYPLNKKTELVDKKWHLCDGTNGTPDLRNRFIYGGDGTNNGDTGGEASVTLTVQTIPAHGHTGTTSTNGNHSHTVTTFKEHRKINGNSYDGYCAGSTDRTTSTAGNHQHSLNIDSTGGGQPHNNMPPYYVLAYIMKL